MRAKENYTPYMAAGLLLTLAILASFELYILREPSRIAADEANDKAIAVNAGAALFKKNCTLCHGDNGEGTPGKPALNDKTFLATANDDTIFSVISSGVPNTQMPSWNQSHGGPLTDEDVRNLVTFIRSWQDTAPDRQATAMAGDPNNGARLYTAVCAVCHGTNGAGTDRAPKLNDPTKLSQFDDKWYKDTITKGRPAAGMPTWGTVLSPSQVADLVAYIDNWRQAAATQAATTAPTSAATTAATSVATLPPTAAP